MQVTYELVQKDFYEALIAHRNGRKLAKWSIRGLAAFAVFAMLLAITALVLDPSLSGVKTAASFACLVGFWLVLIWGAPWWSSRVQFRNQPGAKGEKTFIVDSTGCHFRGNTVTGDAEWAHFVRWLESKNVFLLYSSPIMFNIIPKRAFTPEQLTEFRSLVAQNVIDK